MEERILSYSSIPEIQTLVSSLAKENFLLVRQSAKDKKLFFKKYSSLPNTHLFGEP